MRQLQMARWQTRESDDGTVTLEGLAAPYGTVIDYAGFREQFAADAFDPTQAHGTPLLRDHDRSQLIGHITAARNTADGLHVEAVIQPTALGRDTATLLRSGSLRGLSVGFEPGAVDERDGVITYRSAALRELSLTPTPAYPTATVAAVRHEEDAAVPETAAAVSDDRPATPDYVTRSEFESYLARQFDGPTTERPPLDVRAAFAALVSGYGADRARIATRADMVSSGNTGLTDTGRTSREVIEYFDDMRYFTSRVASLPFPETGIVHTLPRKTQRTQVGQAAEKAAPPSRTVLTDTTQFTGVWYKGYLDISYELIRTSSPGAVEVATEDMLAEAAVESELELVAAVETAATYLAPLVFTDYGAFVASVRAAVRAVRTAAGKGQPKFALTSDNWDKLLGFVDTTDRRLLSTVGSTNADGSAALTAEELTLAGIVFFESPHSSVDVAYNDNSLKRSELPPIQLTADNVPLIGRDVAVLGNIMAIPRIPEGVIKLATDPGRASRAAGK